MPWGRQSFFVVCPRGRTIRADHKKRWSAPRVLESVDAARTSALSALPAELFLVQFLERIHRRTDRILVIQARQDLLPPFVVRRLQRTHRFRILRGDVRLLSGILPDVVELPGAAAAPIAAHRAVAAAAR